MNYEETIAYIHSAYWKGTKDGLARTRELLALLGNPQKELRFVHVAGTNGKGSVVEFLEQGLMGCGYHMGTYISPYIEVFNELQHTIPMPFCHNWDLLVIQNNVVLISHRHCPLF